MKSITPYLIVFLLALSTTVNAQKWEAGIMLGASNYSGDLSHQPIVLEETNFAYGVLLRYNWTSKYTLKANFYNGQISGSDANADSERLRNRNLHFKSHVWDFSAQVEYNILGFDITSKHERFSPYIFAGISVFNFDPQAEIEIDGEMEWVRLQPLGTEGQGTTRYNDREKYALTQIAIPFGFGVKQAIGKHWVIGAEFGWRKTFTDYLDDVSTTYVERGVLERERNGELAYRLSYRTPEVLGDDAPRVTREDERGRSTTQDWYMMGGITITYTIFPRSCFRF